MQRNYPWLNRQGINGRWLRVRLTEPKLNIHFLISHLVNFWHSRSIFLKHWSIYYRTPRTRAISFEPHSAQHLTLPLMKIKEKWKEFTALEFCKFSTYFLQLKVCFKWNKIDKYSYCIIQTNVYIVHTNFMWYLLFADFIIISICLSCFQI